MANKKGAAIPQGGHYGMKMASTSKLMLGAFIFLAVATGALLTNGILPKSTLTPQSKDPGDFEIIQETPIPGVKGLQLRTIRFKACSNKASVGLLVDRSGSMAGPKMENLKSALSTFTLGLGDDSIIGMDSFSSNDGGATGVTENVPFSKNKDVKPQVASAISGLVALGGTNTRSAFTFMKDKLLAAKTKFPENPFTLIFLSDGVPETNPKDCASGIEFNGTSYGTTGARCFANSEDPTQAPSVAQEIKDAGIKIYSIAIYNPSESSDVFFLPSMRDMMKKVASPDSYYETPNPADLKTIYRAIASKICNEIK